MALAKQTPNQAASSVRDLKHRVLTCLNKLSDRDTHSAAAAELESIARTLSPESIPPFISSISATDASDKSPVRKQCVRLFSLLSEAHGDSLSPFLPKILSAVLRRLRDPDTAVRSACVNAIASVSSHITKPPFTAISKPLIEALVTEQDQNPQIGAALCLASAMDASPNAEPLYLKKLLPRLEKLLKCDSFKAKPALLTLIASVIGAGGASTHQVLRSLVPCLVEFLSSEDWAARKAAAEALVRLALVEKDVLLEFKEPYLKTFESKKFDKVKIVRETMNQMVEAWKEIPEEALAPPELQSSVKEDASDNGSKTSCSAASRGPVIMKNNCPGKRSSLPDGSIMPNDKCTGPAMFRKLDFEKPKDCAVEISSRAPTMTMVCENDPEGGDEKVTEKVETNRFMKAKTRRAIFNKSAEDRAHKFGGFKARNRVVPCHDEDSESTASVSDATVGNGAEDLSRNQDSVDLCFIRNHLIQLENQQSYLLDLLQNFIGSSQKGMHMLETRVHGLELALDEISYDLAVSTGRMPYTKLEGSTCCKIPGAEILSSKFWRRPESRFPASRISPVHDIASENGVSGQFKLENRRFWPQNGSGFIVNPLADIRSDPRGFSGADRVMRNVRGA